MGEYSLPTSEHITSDHESSLPVVEMSQRTQSVRTSPCPGNMS